MSRPAGVSASAVVAIIGSILVLLLAAFMGAAPFLPSTAAVPPGFGPIVMVTAVVLLALAILGGWTGVALWKLQPWARISTLVFAGIVSVMSALGVVVMLIIPAPPMPDPAQQAAFETIRPVIVGVYAVPLVIGIWWLAYFNRSAIKAAFAAPPVPGEPPERPLGVSIIGWLAIVGAVFMLPMSMSGMPGFLAGLTFTGWGAKLYYLAFGALSAYLGWSVLKLRETGRRLMIGLYTFGLLHTALVLFVPAIRDRMLAVQRSMAIVAQPAGGTPPLPIEAMTTTMMAVTVVMIGALMWILVRARPHFR